MPLSNTPWTVSLEDLEALFKAPSLTAQLYDRAVTAERLYLDNGIRQALGMWVSELEPELMFRVGEHRPFGITARGHGTPYVVLRWDEAFTFRCLPAQICAPGP